MLTTKVAVEVAQAEVAEALLDTVPDTLVAEMTPVLELIETGAEVVVALEDVELLDEVGDAGHIEIVPFKVP